MVMQRMQVIEFNQARSLKTEANPQQADKHFACHLLSLHQKVVLQAPPEPLDYASVVGLMPADLAAVSHMIGFRLRC